MEWCVLSRRIERNSGEIIKKEGAVELADDFVDFLSSIPKTTDIKEIFNYLNNAIIDPFTNRDLYWLKMTLQQAADLFIVNYLPLSNSSERDLIRRVWGFVDTAF